MSYQRELLSALSGFDTHMFIWVGISSQRILRIIFPSLPNPNVQHLDNWTYYNGTTSLGFVPEQPFREQTVQKMWGRTPYG